MSAWMLYILKINVIAAAIIFLTVLLSRLTKKKYSLKWKYYMWLAVSLFLLIPLDFSAKSPVQLQVGRPSSGYVTDTEGAGAGSNLSPQRAESQTEMPAAAQASGAQASYIAIRIPSDKIPVYGLLQLMSVIWIAGVAVLLAARVLRYRISLHKMMRWSYPVTDRETLDLYRQICVQKHIRRRPELFISPELSTPVLAGMRHTGLYLTAEAYDMEELRFILSHEITHYKRGDLWYKMLLIAVSTVYWFNPALVWMRREAEKDIENLCDGSVAEHYTKEEQMEYSRLLLKTAAFQNHVPYLAASLNDSTLIFKERIMYIRNLRYLKRNAAAAAVLIVIMTASRFLIGCRIAGEETTAVRPGIVYDGTGINRESQSAEAPGGTSALPGTAKKDTKQRDESKASGDSAAAVMNPGDLTGSEELPLDGAGTAAVPASAAPGDQEGVSGEGAVNGINSGSEGPAAANASQSAGEDDRVQDDFSGTADDTAASGQVTLYTDNGMAATYINQGTDGGWYDGYGSEYQANGDGTWTALANGKQWTETAPESPADHAVSQQTVIDGEALNRQTLYQQAEGSWLNGAGGAYTSNGDGTWTGPDGTLWYGE